MNLITYKMLVKPAIKMFSQKLARLAGFLTRINCHKEVFLAQRLAT